MLASHLKPKLLWAKREELQAPATSAYWPQNRWTPSCASASFCGSNSHWIAADHHLFPYGRSCYSLLERSLGHGRWAHFRTDTSLATGSASPRRDLGSVRHLRLPGAGQRGRRAPLRASRTGEPVWFELSVEVLTTTCERSRTRSRNGQLVHGIAPGATPPLVRGGRCVGG